MEINCKHFRVLHAGLAKGKRKNVGIGKEVAAKKLKVFNLHQVLYNYPMINFRLLQR